MKKISIIGVDLTKTVFQLHGVDAEGTAVLRRQLRRNQMLEFFQRLPGGCLVGMEGALLGAGTDEAGARSPADAAQLCQRLRQAREDRQS